MFPSRGPRSVAPVVALAVVGAVAALSCRRDLGPAPTHDCSPQATAAACSGGSGGVGGGGGNTGGAGGGGAGGRPIDAALPLDVAPDTAPPVDLPPPDLAPPCGKGGQACCPGNRCDNGGCCIDDKCVGPGEPCRIIEASCVAFVCGGLCGGLNLNCCPGSQCTAPGTFCGANNVCAECGKAGQPCCIDNYCNAGLTCQAGACAP